MDIVFGSGEMSSAEVSLHEHEVENVGPEIEFIPRHLTTYTVTWEDTVSWSVTVQVAADRGHVLTLRGVFRSGAVFHRSVRPGVAGLEVSAHRVVASRQVEVPPMTRIVISVVGSHEVERIPLSGAVTGFVAGSRVTDVRFKITMLTPQGDYLRTQYAAAELHELPS